MTLISAINDHGHPSIISDWAISQTETSNAILLPSTNENSHKLTPVVGCNIKTIIIQDLLCVGFSGLVSEIESLVSDIRDFFLHRPVSRDTLNELLPSLTYATQCSVLYARAEPGKEDDQVLILRSGSGWLLDQSRTDLTILSCGSGAADWNKLVLRSYRYSDDSEMNELFSRQKALQSCITFLTRERIFADNLLDGWGGGFDIVYYHGGRFQRLNNVSYAFYAVDRTNPDTILTPLSIIHQTYAQGKAIARHFEKRDYNIYVISEFGDKLPYTEDDPNCLSKEVVSIVHIYNGKTYEDTIAVQFWDLDPDAPPAFHTTRLNDNFGIKFREIYYDKLNEAVTLFTAER